MSLDNRLAVARASNTQLSPLSVMFFLLIRDPAEKPGEITDCLYGLSASPGTKQITGFPLLIIRVVAVRW